MDGPVSTRHRACSRTDATPFSPSPPSNEGPAGRTVVLAYGLYFSRFESVCAWGGFIVVAPPERATSFSSLAETTVQVWEKHSPSGRAPLHRRQPPLFRSLHLHHHPPPPFLLLVLSSLPFSSSSLPFSPSPSFSLLPAAFSIACACFLSGAACSAHIGQHNGYQRPVECELDSSSCQRATC